MSAGDPEAPNELYPLVYNELRRIAGRAMSSQAVSHTLQPTALIHEAFLRLTDNASEWSSREHFLGVAAKAMRSILVDHARARQAAKRRPDGERVLLDDSLPSHEARGATILEVDDALHLLEASEPRLASIVEMRFFGGLTVVETAHVLGVSKPTLLRDWRLARAWLYSHLHDESDEPRLDAS